jgi:hypothetical protein
LLKDTIEVWVEGKAVIIQGKLSDKEHEIKILVDKAKAINLDNAESAFKSFRSTKTLPADKIAEKKTGD